MANTNNGLRRRPRSNGTTRARQSFQCRVGELISSTAQESNAAGVLRPPVELDKLETFEDGGERAAEVSL